MILRFVAALAALAVFAGVAAPARAAHLHTVRRDGRLVYPLIVKNVTNRDVVTTVYASGRGSDAGAPLDEFVVRANSTAVQYLLVEGHPEPATVRAVVYVEPHLRRTVLFDRTLPFTATPSYSLEAIDAAHFEFINAP